jgi:hypothetical protein
MVGSMILNGVIALVLLLNLGGTLRGAGANPMAAGFALAMGGGMLGLCITTIVKLKSAYRVSGAAGAMTPAAYWTMMPPQPGGSGYGYPPPPPGAGPVALPPPPGSLPNQPPPPPL